jgi:hypothetical protein
LYPTSTALKDWQDGLVTKAEATKSKYEEKLRRVLRIYRQEPDELIVQRQQDLLNKDIKVQRRIESQFLAFIAKKKKDGYSISTQQIAFAINTFLF